MYPKEQLLVILKILENTFNTVIKCLWDPFHDTICILILVEYFCLIFGFIFNNNLCKEVYWE